MKWFMISTGLILFASTQVYAENRSGSVKTDDICSERPDLCGGSKSSVTSTSKKIEQMRRPTRGPASVGAASTGRCRKKGESYNLDDARLPICKATEEESLGAALDREPASNEAPPRRVSFTSYLNANANHPSISGRLGGRQDAFIVPTRPSTITGSNLPNVGDASADGLSMKDTPPAAAPPASGSTSTGPSNPNN